MNRNRWFALLLAALLVVPYSFSQMGPGAGQRTRARNYDPATEVTVKGTVEDVTHPAHGSQTGTHLTLKSDAGSYQVHVGPTSYVSSQQFTFAKGDTIEVIGSKTKIGGQEVLLARQITKEGKVLTLRNPQGIPMWSQGPRK